MKRVEYELQEQKNKIGHGNDVEIVERLYSFHLRVPFIKKFGIQLSLRLKNYMLEIS